jgi:ComF family protein
VQISLDRLAAGLLGLVYPAECPVCLKPSNSFITAPICKQCWDSIERLDGPVCRVCRKALGTDRTDICGQCLGDPPPYVGTVAYGPYKDTLKTAIHLTKYGKLKRLTRPLGTMLASLSFPEVDVVVSVPLGPRTLRTREFNQTFLLGQVVSRRLGVPLMSGVLYKKKDTPPQAGLSRAARMLNLRGAFATRRKLSGERVLLVDDVMTTGATARACARTLLRAGATEVHIAALARTV